MRSAALNLSLLLVFACSASIASAQNLQPLLPSEAANDQVLRLALQNQKFVTVLAQEPKPGYIYNHFDARLNRRAWSFYLGDGRFWNAFGERTTQPAVRFDLDITRGEGMEEIQQTDPELVDRARSTDQLFYLRMNADGQWYLLRIDSIPQVFNAETGMRWEQHFPERYIPVSHTFGYRWQVRDGEFVPASY